MKNITYIFFLVLGLLLLPMISYAQEDRFREEESAEIYLEDYSDEFQDNFFEALKQKGIENHDKAINLLLECKQIAPDHAVVDYELAKAYLASKNYILAQEYAITALTSRPEDYWVLKTAFTIFRLQGTTLEGAKLQLPLENRELRKNLASIYYERQDFDAALKIVNGLERSAFSEELTFKIKDALRGKKDGIKETPLELTEKIMEENPVDNYLKLISDLLDKEDYKEVQAHSSEAIDNFPAQPYFYFTYGWALNKAGKNKEAVPILESGLDFILDDDVLANKIYKELANAHMALGNSSKANMYLSKIKPGL